MTQEVKDILEKPAAEVTEEEKKTLEESKLAYAKEVSEVCSKHGWQHVPFLEVTVSGIVPKLAVIPFNAEEPKKDA